MAFKRTLRGVTESHAIDNALIGSTDARRLNERAGRLQKLFTSHGTLTAKDKEHTITGPVSLIDTVLELGRKGIGFQRYKGLGEMNPLQLRETAMAPDTRRLVQLSVGAPKKVHDLLDMLLSKKRAPDRKTWLEKKGNLAEIH